MPRKMPRQKPGRSKQNYATPEDLIYAVLKRLKITSFKFDFAADKKNSKGKKFWSKKDDALAQSPYYWSIVCRHGWGWLNPPFANIAKWAKACRRAMAMGANIAFLVPASVGSNWFLKYIWEESGVTVIYLNGRPCFDGKAGFPKDCMIVLFQGEDVAGQYTRRPFTSEVWTWKETAE